MPGVAEVELGTQLRDVIEQIGGGVGPDREIVAVLSGVSNPLLPARALDTPMSYETLSAAGGGLGAAGFIVFDDTTDLAALAAGVARFLAVESCGQCRHCKDDGLALSNLLDDLVADRAGTGDELSEIAKRLDIVAEGARCNLATQQQVVVGSILDRFPDAFARARRPHRACGPTSPGGVDPRTGRRPRGPRRARALQATRLDPRPGRLRPVAGRPSRRQAVGAHRVNEESTMPEPEPMSPADVGVPEEVPELSQIEGARLLGNDARERLHADGFDDAQIDEWAETFIAEVSSGTVDQFVEWISRRERDG